MFSLALINANIQYSLLNSNEIMLYNYMESMGVQFLKINSNNDQPEYRNVDLTSVINN